MWNNNNDQIAHSFQTKERTDDVRISENVTFSELLLSDNVLSGLTKSGFYKPSPIQLKAIPLGRCGLDLVVQAKSGTGKTCVFSVIALENTETGSPLLQVLILAPTREIALQIHGVISSIGQDIEGLSVQVFIGGTKLSEDKIKAKRCHIAIGSPGRLMQLIDLGVFVTTNVRLFVLDEADKLVEEGSFQSQINWIFSSLPANKQMIALSATYPELLAEFLTRYMREPTFVRLDPSQPSLLGLKQFYLVTKPCSLPYIMFEEKTQHVIDILSSVSFQQALIFSNYHSRAETICNALNHAGWPSTFISSTLDQSQRIEAIGKLKQFKCRVLISTDLTSRGIDAQNVDMVINMDIPNDWETYMHRIGRAGRFGSRGIAVSVVGPGAEEVKLHSIAAKCNASISALHDVRTLKELKTMPALQVPSDLTTNLSGDRVSEKEQSFDTCASTNGSTSVGVKIRTESWDQLDKDGSLNQHFLTSDNNSSSLLPNDMHSIDDNKDAELNASPDIPLCSDENVGASSTTEPLQKCFPPNVNFEETVSKVPIESMSALDKNQTSSSHSSGTTSSEIPLVPSLMELQIQSQGLRKNIHYLFMNYEELKADFDFHVRTGKFSDAPTFAKVSADKYFENAKSELNKQMEQLNIAAKSEATKSNKTICQETSILPESTDTDKNFQKLDDSSHITGLAGSVTNVRQNSDITNEKLTASSSKTQKSAQGTKVVNALSKKYPMSAAAGLKQVKHWVTNVEQKIPITMESNTLIQTEKFSMDNCDNKPVENIFIRDFERRKSSSDVHPYPSSRVPQPVKKKGVGFEFQMEQNEVESEESEELGTDSNDVDEERSSSYEEESTSSDNSMVDSDECKNETQLPPFAPHLWFPPHCPYPPHYAPYYPSPYPMPAPLTYPSFPSFAPPSFYPWASPSYNEATFSSNLYHWALQHARYQVYNS
ncbi:uncharacterized protein LOC143462679 [Clavelina lepadiformis]|uniref:uncharacterized protein LOC143462679 n=1 Tax=Clavelina lepadiformis TaxID=159417 RepID=UPI004041F7E0